MRAKTLIGFAQAIFLSIFMVLAWHFFDDSMRAIVQDQGARAVCGGLFASVSTILMGTSFDGMK